LTGVLFYPCDLHICREVDHSKLISGEAQSDAPMDRLSFDPFTCAVIPKFRNFDLSIVHSRPSSLDTTEDFVTTLKAIHLIRPPPTVSLPPSAEFFNWDTVSSYELRFPFAHDRLYKHSPLSTFLDSLSSLHSMSSQLTSPFKSTAF
jgi:hypothetical protein